MPLKKGKRNLSNNHENELVLTASQERALLAKTSALADLEAVNRAFLESMESLTHPSTDAMLMATLKGASSKATQKVSVISVLVLDSSVVGTQKRVDVRVPPDATVCQLKELLWKALSEEGYVALWQQRHRLGRASFSDEQAEALDGAEALTLLAYGEELCRPDVMLSELHINGGSRVCAALRLPMASRG